MVLIWWYLLPGTESNFSKELEGKFDHVYGITGTCMLIIDQYVDEYEIHKGNFENMY